MNQDSINKILAIVQENQETIESATFGSAFNFMALVCLTAIMLHLQLSIIKEMIDRKFKQL